VSRGWVDSLISRHSAELTEKKSSPQEKPHLQVPRIFLEDTICSMHETFQGCPVGLVFYIDEVGISYWEDRRPEKVVVPITVAAHCSQHSPSNISECETHFDRDVHLCRWRVSYPVCGNISRFRGSSPGSRGNQDADCEVFDLQTTPQTLRQC
jgi:hypothetical protein